MNTNPKETHPQIEEHLTTEEVAAITRSARNTVLWWRHVGRGPRSFKVGRRVLYKRADVEAWLSEQYAQGR